MNYLFCLIVVVMVCLGLAGAFPGGGIAYAQEPERFADLSVEVEVVDDSGASPEIMLHVSNLGNQPAYDVDVAFEQTSGQGGWHLFGYPTVGTVNVARLESIGRKTVRWQIPVIPAHAHYTAEFSQVGKHLVHNENTLHVFSANGHTGSFEHPDRLHNNSAQGYMVIDGSGKSWAAQPDYSVIVSSESAGANTANFAVTVVLPDVQGPAGAIGLGCVNVRLTSGLTAGTPTFDPANDPTLHENRQRSFDTSSAKQCGGAGDATGVIDLPNQHGELMASMTLPVTVNSGATLSEQCLTAEIFALPPAGGGRFYDDPSDNVARACLGAAPDEPAVFSSGHSDLFTWYDCSETTTHPCNDSVSLELVALVGTAEVGLPYDIFDPDNVLVHVTDPAGRATSSDSKSAALVWSTGFEEPSTGHGHGHGSDRPGIIMGANTEGLDLETTTDADLWGTPHASFTTWELGEVSVALSGPGTMSSWYHNNNNVEAWGYWGGSLAPGGTYTTTERWLGASADGGFRSDLWSEFSALGTYEFTMTIAAPYDDDTTDSTPGTKYSSTKTYTFHVGPMVDLEATDGGASSHVAADRNALTILAANNGPDHSLKTRVTGLPPGAEMLYINQGHYDSATGVWNIGELKHKDFRQSEGKPQHATLILSAASGDTADVTVTGSTDYTVCIDSDGDTLEHTNHTDCKADSATTNTWHAAVCVKNSDGTVNTATTHDTEAECDAITDPHTWTTNVCASSDDSVRAGRTEKECDGWFQGSVYDYKPDNNTATITAARGTGGVGPDVPANPRTQTGTTTVMWDDVEFLYGLPVARYEVQWLGSDWTMLGDAVTENQHVDAAPSGRRDYRVRAVNVAGVAGPWSRSAVTVQAGHAGPPVNLRAQADGNNAIDVSWDAPEDAGGSAITGYTVQWSADGSEGSWRNAGSVTDLTFKHRGLQVGAIRYYRVAARNSGGLGLWSDPVMGQTVSGAPEAPTLSAKSLSDYEIELTWNEPKDNGQPITGYRIDYSADGSADSWSRLATPGADPTTYTDSTLQANTQRYYRIRAVNSVGAGAWSRTVSARTQLTPPIAPSLTGVAADGPNAIIVTWAEPFLFDGELGITQYQVQYAKDPDSEIWRGPQTLSASARSWRHTGLKSGETWYYQVRASNGGGRWSVWSYTGSATTASDNAPRSVSNFRAQYDKASDQIALTWDDFSSGEATFSYELERLEEDSDWRNLATVSGGSGCSNGKCAHNDGDLWPGARLQYRVRAVNNEGDKGPWSSQQSVSVPAAPPDAPRINWAEADGSNHVVIQWEPPYYDGGTPVTGYRLLWCRVLDGADDNPCEVAPSESNPLADPPGYSAISLGATARTYTHSVSPGYYYHYLLRATNGGNRWSEWREYDIYGWIITYAGVPAAPGLTARAVDASQIKLTWNKPNAYGSEIGEYWLYVYHEGDNLYDWDNILDIIRVPGDRTEWTIGDLSPGATRYFRIRALNDNGEGKYSALRHATTLAN